ncbi:MAG TPA: thioredoxin family protein [Armatimonadota bacterium]|nr:thioredoxin family protein [Armatimonadota bacterium]
MGAVTYPNPEVERFIQDHFVPVQFNVVEQPEVMERFNAHWTPTLLIHDADGREHRRSEGYLDPQRFLAEMALARLKAAINHQDLQNAVHRAEEAQQKTRGDAAREPEALYWSAVAAYKSSGDAQNLIAGWNRLLDQFPQSDWAKKAGFIRM